MKKVLMATMALALVAALLGLGVYANWSDTETSKENYFQAGSLDLKVNGADDPIGAVIEVKDVVPGDEGSVNVKLKNVGSLDGEAYLHIKNLVDDENGVYEPEEPDDGTEGELSGVITIKINGNEVGKLDEIECQKIKLGELEASQEMDVTISYKVDDQAGNNIMSDKCTFDIEFGLEQK